MLKEHDFPFDTLLHLVTLVTPFYTLYLHMLYTFYIMLHLFAHFTPHCKTCQTAGSPCNGAEGTSP